MINPPPTSDLFVYRESKVYSRAFRGLVAVVLIDVFLSGML